MIFVVSTTGQGDLPSSARLFWKILLRKKLPRDYLSTVHFSSFGLGDRSYPRFNWAARKLHKRITQLGGIEIYPRGEADEQHDEGLDASFVPWSVGLKKLLLRDFPLAEGVEPIPDNTLLEPKWLLHSVAADAGKLESVDANPHTSGNHSKNTRATLNDPNQKDRFKVTLRENRRLTPESHWQDVRHLAFTAEVPMYYGPGDVLTIYPQNSMEAVNDIILMMNWADVADELIEFLPNQQKSQRYPPPPLAAHSDARITLRYLLTHHLDITAIPRRSFFSLIAHFTKDQFHKDRLLEFTDSKYVDELYDYTTRPRRSLIEVLQEFESVKIPWQWAAAVLPELRGRQFSIASGGELKKSSKGNARFELLVAIVKYKTVIKKIREGVCTKYLAGLEPGCYLRVSLQRGGLGVSEHDLEVPTIMIGPGTGVAPMRSMIWERNLSKQNHNIADSTEQKDTVNGNSSRDASLLIFGGRNENADFFYKEEWKTFQAADKLQVISAFSRDQVRKYYVQDAIRGNSRLIYDMLRFQNATVYVCGSSGKMPTAVRAALVDVVQEHGSSSENGVSDKTITDEGAALRYLETMERTGRYKQETW